MQWANVYDEKMLSFLTKILEAIFLIREILKNEIQMHYAAV